PAVEMVAAEGDDGVCSDDRPEHAGLFEAGADNSLAPGFNHSGAYEQVLASESGIAHAFGVVLKVGGFDSDGIGNRGCGGIDASKEANQFFDFAAIKFGLMAQNPLLLSWDVARVQKASQRPEMLPGMKQIDDLHGSGKVLIGIVPYPLGPVSDYDLLRGPAPAAIPGFQVDSGAKLSSGFNTA